ncbi:MAG: hypothetical protein M1832_006438 [Thelocarpon impressellum]|nr:MAG: hypothetical protein M1832_006438 [Thelocarpon impressellum]
MSGRQASKVVGQQASAAVQEAVDIDMATSHDLDRPVEEVPQLSEERRQRSLDDHAFEISSFASEVGELSREEQDSQTVLYLAYGSNLAAKTFKGTRGIKPIAQINVVAPEITLTFDLPGMPYMEPCFANVRYRDQTPKRGEAEASQVFEKEALLTGHHERGYHKNRWAKGLVGVVYEVSKKDYATIIRTEGGGGSYQDVMVTCHPLTNPGPVPWTPATMPFRAHTLYAPANVAAQDLEKAVAATRRLQRPDPSYAQASARYLKLLTDGAEEHGLPDEYRAYLRDIRPYKATTVRQGIGKGLFIASWGPLMMLVFGSKKLFSDKQGRSPDWVNAATGAFFTVMWACYDWVWKGPFGDGERTLGQ